MVAAADQTDGAQPGARTECAAVEVKIGVQNVMREIIIETDSTAAEVSALVESAATSGTLTLKDTKGRTVLVPASALGYVEIGVEEHRPVGFGV